MPTSNGKTYEMQYLTDEETAVINAMRRGARISVDFHGNETLGQVDELMTLFAGIEMTRTSIHDLTGANSIGISHWHDRVWVNYYIKNSRPL